MQTVSEQYHEINAELFTVRHVQTNSSVGLSTMYDFPDSSAIFDIFEVGLANSHILVTNHLDTPKLAIFE